MHSTAYASSKIKLAQDPLPLKVLPISPEFQDVLFRNKNCAAKKIDLESDPLDNVKLAIFISSLQIYMTTTNPTANYLMILQQRYPQ